MKWPVLIWLIVTGYASSWQPRCLGFAALGMNPLWKTTTSTAQQSSMVFNLCLEQRWLPPVRVQLFRLEEKSPNRNKILKIIARHNWMWSFSCYSIYSCVLNSWEEKNGNQWATQAGSPSWGSNPAPSGGHPNHQHILFRKFRCLAWMRKFSLPFCRLVSSSMYISVCPV